MSDQYGTAPLQPTVTPAHTEAEEEYLQTLHATLKPEATAAYFNYYLARTPSHLQEDMKALIEGDLPEPPPVEPPVADPPAAA